MNNRRNQFQTYLGDTILLVVSGSVFYDQGTSKEPNLIVMGICVAILMGRVAIALDSWLGGRNTTEQSPSLVPRGSQSESPSSSIRPDDET